MWWYAHTPDKRIGPYIRAVHNIEWVINSPSGTASVYINSAVYLTPDHYDAVMSWIKTSFPVRLQARRGLHQEACTTCLRSYC